VRRLVAAVVLLWAGVAQGGTLNASWTAPTLNTDGTPIVGSLTYRVYYFLFPNTPCPGTQFIVTNPDTTTATLTGLTAGMTYNAMVTAVDMNGTESDCSLMASAVANPDATTLPQNVSGAQLAFAPEAVQPTTVTFGDTAVETGTAGNLGGALDAQATTLTTPGTLQSLSIYVDTSAGKLALGLYDAGGAGGGPGKLLASTPVTTPTTGWNTIPVTSKVPLAAGNYWLAVTVDSNPMVLRRVLSGSAKRAFSFTLMNPFPASGFNATQKYSLYGTVSIP
jgi:hypothetical protein